MTEISIIILALILLLAVALSIVVTERYWINQKRFDQYLLLAKELKLTTFGKKEPLLFLLQPANGSHYVSGLYKTYHLTIRYRYRCAYERHKWCYICLSLASPALVDKSPGQMLQQLTNESGALFKGVPMLENGVLYYEERGDMVDDQARRWMVARVERLVVIADKLSGA